MKMSIFRENFHFKSWSVQELRAANAISKVRVFPANSVNNINHIKTYICILVQSNIYFSRNMQELTIFVKHVLQIINYA